MTVALKIIGWIYISVYALMALGVSAMLWRKRGKFDKT